ncbi:MAG TPA: PAS domain S-box protein [Gemmatimonadaceae bacterium]
MRSRAAPIRAGQSSTLAGDSRVSYVGMMSSPTLTGPAPGTPTAAAERALSSRFVEIFQHAFEFIGLVSADGILLDANLRSLEFIGVSRESVVGRRFWETPWWTAAPGDAARLEDAIREAAAGRFVRYDVVHIGHDGAARTFDFSLTPVLAADGIVQEIVAEGRDITELRVAQDARRISEARLATIVLTAGDAIVAIDSAQRITLFNPAAEHMFGYDAHEVLGQTLAMLLPAGESQDHHRAYVHEFLQGEPEPQFLGQRRAIRGRRKSGDIFPAEITISRTYEGDDWKATAILRDVSERQRIEDALRFLSTAGSLLVATLDDITSLQAVARLAVPTLADWCIIEVVDDDGALRRVAAAARDADKQILLDEARLQSGYDWPGASVVSQVVERGVPRLQPDVSDKWVEARVRNPAQAARAKRLGYRSLLVVPLVARGRSLGAMSFVMAESNRQYDGSYLSLAEQLASRVAAAIDNAHLYKRARLAIQARDDVLAVVSHDLRNPLSAISMCSAALLREPAAEDEGVRHLIDTVSQSAEWMGRIIRDLLDVASIDAGALALQRAQCSIEDIVEDTVDLLQPIAAGNEITLDVELPQDVPPVEADAERLQQVLSNLVGNACKFTSAGGTITIRVERAGDSAQVSVNDTGRGIPAEDLPHLFDRFWQSRRGARQRGTGLGLAIAKGIVEAHGGRLWAESTEGSGSTFYFTIPL